VDKSESYRKRLPDCKSQTWFGSGLMNKNEAKLKNLNATNNLAYIFHKIAVEEEKVL
jgi:hypothetical protein